ncbi:actin-binding Rho-activating protein [Erpetoichthys calabaricus]|uniref:actin-binding Rho-activating protein n=1 Tax=Erpetoichthys calabaricus TaxID=27687 RepID=UPI00109FF892|nr:actin-binding Rho-activating protein [Erpetoichthys calabaricus]
MTMEQQPLSRAVRKLRCAGLVSGLSKTWQVWASEHSQKQLTSPKGWHPDIIEENGNADFKKEWRVDQSIERKSGRQVISAGKDRVNALIANVGNKVSSKEGSKGEGISNMSPTRRRCHSRQAASAVKAWCQHEQGKVKAKMDSRSSSLDTEDSGLGDDTSQSETDEENKLETKTDRRPKILVATINDLRRTWQKWSEEHIEQQKLNPFSDEFDYEHSMAVRLVKGDVGYGRPKEGSRTAERAKRAQKHIHKEMEELCFIIRDVGVQCKDGYIRVTFGRLFDRYVTISDKVVGILLRCRKHGMVAFDGEMLWQGQDDNVVITLLA